MVRNLQFRYLKWPLKVVKSSSHSGTHGYPRLPTHQNGVFMVSTSLWGVDKVDPYWVNKGGTWCHCRSLCCPQLLMLVPPTYILSRVAKSYRKARLTSFSTRDLTRVYVFVPQCLCPCSIMFPSLHFGQANSVEAARVQWNVHQRTRVVPQQAQLVPQLPSQADGWLSMGCGRIIIATHIELTPPPQATKLQSERYVNDSFVQLHAELPAQPSKLRRLLWETCSLSSPVSLTQVS